MRRIIDGYYRLLTWLLVVSVAILIIPVSLQIFSRYTALIPSYIWTEEMARFFFIWMIMLGAMIGIRDSSHFDIDLFPDLSPRANAVLKLFAHTGILVFRARLRLVRHQVRAVRLEPALRARRTADVVHLHRLADLRRHLAAVPRAADPRQPAHARSIGDART